MKKLATLTALFLIGFSLFAQKQKSYNAWKLGLNFGGTYQCSDVTPYHGLGYGLTFEKANFQNERNFFDLTWRFRYLKGTTYGQDYSRGYGIQNNSALNGEANNGINYVSNGGYAFQNYKMKFDEGSFELVLGLNRLREKTGILLYGWGGIGFTAFKTMTDQLDASGKMYDYSTIDSSGVKTAVKTQLDALYDGNYETASQGSSKLNWRLTPSAGVGFGYQFGRNFSLAFEYKTSWPHTDQLDGNQWNVANVKSGDNDHYHYAGLHLLFRIGGGSTSGGNPTGNNTYNPNPVTPVNPVVSNNSPLPVIVFTAPQSNPYQTNMNTINVEARIQNVTSANNISLKINGNPMNNFSYNTYSNMMTIFSGLSLGSNVFEVSAYNQAGNAVQTMVVNYYTGDPNSKVGEKPIVNIVSPSQNPYTSQVNNVNVTATVLNVDSRNEIMVISNGVSVNSFNYDTRSKLLSVVTQLIAGTNNVTVIGSNANGSDSKTVTITYNTSAGPVTGSGTAKPEVMIISPAQNPDNSPTCFLNLVVSVKNVGSKNDISLKIDGVSVNNFDYNTASQHLTYQGNLGNGITHKIVITATTAAGSASDELTEICGNGNTGNGNPGGTPAAKPVVNIISPAHNPDNSPTCFLNLVASVKNVSSKNDISLKIDGVAVSNFEYNAAAQHLTYKGDLNGNSLFHKVLITATTQAGSASAELTVVCGKKDHGDGNPSGTPAKPEVMIISPAHNPDNSPTCFLNLVASVKNVSSKNEISLKIDGVEVSSFDYNPASKHLTYMGNLGNGTTHKILITATTLAGTASAELTEICGKKGPGNEGSGGTPAAKPEVMIISPAQNPDNSPTCFLNLVASVKNVSSKNEISLKIDGVEVSSFDYNLASKHLTYQGNMGNGNTHKILITATTQSGTATAELTEICGNKGNGNGGPGGSPAAKPEIRIISPAQNPDNSPTCFLNLVASVKNVSSKNDISLKIDGVEVSSFDYNLASKHLTYQGNMGNGNTHKILITATTQSGTATAELTEICGNKGNGNGGPGGSPAAKPEIRIISPAQNPDNSPTCFLNLVASVKNVSLKSDITLKIDGSNVVNFDYNKGSQHLTYQGNFAKSMTHNVEINATTSGGTATAQLTVICFGNGPGGGQGNGNQGGGNTGSTGNTGNSNSGNSGNTSNNNTGNTGNTGNSGNSASLTKPAITFLSPADKSTTADSLVTVSAKIDNVKTKNKITVKINGAQNNNFNFDQKNGTFSLLIKLSAGENKIEITAVNEAGSEIKSLAVTRTGSGRKTIPTGGSGRGGRG